MNDRFKEFTGPDPLEWREYASVAYLEGKLYYLGGCISGAIGATDRMDVRRSSESS